MNDPQMAAGETIIIISDSVIVKTNKTIILHLDFYENETWSIDVSE
jgi:hypothetical protein